MNRLRELKLDYEKIKIESRFRIVLGDKVVSEGKNKWTRYLASSFVQEVASSDLYRSSAVAGLIGRSYNLTARAGTDVSTSTSKDMTDLVSKLDYAPDNITRILTRGGNYQNYTYRAKFLWNPGTIPASTIGEFGVYLWLSDDAWESPAENPDFVSSDIVFNSYYYVVFGVSGAAERLAMRVSSADGDFDPIDYSSLEPLSLEWYVTIKF